MAKTTQRSESHEPRTVSCNYIGQKQLTKRRGISRRALERWHSTGWEPLLLKMGDRMVYREKDVLAYEEQHLVESTRSRINNGGS